MGSTSASKVKALRDALPLFIYFLLFGVIFSLFALFVWRKVLDVSDKGAILKMVKPSEKIEIRL
jgi:hypothetical protein